MAQTDPGRLHEMLEIHALKAAYCRYVDTKQWRRLQALFTDDVVFEGFGFFLLNDRNLKNVEKFIENFKNFGLKSLYTFFTF